jgi:CRISPR-associated protein Csm3
MSMRLVVLKGTLELVTGLHIGSGNDDVHIGGVDSSVIKTAEGDPYIPGSSLKGKIRSLLELAEGSVSSNGGPSSRATFSKSMIPVLFGDLSKEGLTRVLFRDAMLSKASKNKLAEASILATEEKAENSINRINGTATNPRNIERVIPGMQFDVEIVVRLLDGDDEKGFRRIISNGLALLEKDALGGSGSRGYGKVKFRDMTWDGQPFTVEYQK